MLITGSTIGHASPTGVIARSGIVSAAIYPSARSHGFLGLLGFGISTNRCCFVPEEHTKKMGTPYIGAPPQVCVLVSKYFPPLGNDFISVRCVFRTRENVYFICKALLVLLRAGRQGC